MSTESTHPDDEHLCMSTLRAENERQSIRIAKLERRYDETIDERNALLGALRQTERGFDMLHKALMEPSRPRQSIGEVCATWLERTRAALAALPHPE